MCLLHTRTHAQTSTAKSLMNLVHIKFKSQPKTQACVHVLKKENRWKITLVPENPTVHKSFDCIQSENCPEESNTELQTTAQNYYQQRKEEHSYLYQRHVAEVQSEQVVSGLGHKKKEDTCECLLIMTGL